MTRFVRPTLVALSLVAGCGASIQRGAAGDAPKDSPPASVAQPKAEMVSRPTNDADVRFMSGMIPHHAQAVLIARWAPSHGASESVRLLCERIVVAQRDEIALMQTWLHDHHQTVPPANATHMKMMMNGMEHDMLMPGMLTDEQLAELDKARGREFDRLFLTAMIRHHEGAITMVDELNHSYGAAQDDVVFRFSSDVYADQTTEIDRMQRMLNAMPTGARSP